MYNILFYICRMNFGLFMTNINMFFSCIGLLHVLLLSNIFTYLQYLLSYLFSFLVLLTHIPRWNCRIVYLLPIYKYNHPVNCFFFGVAQSIFSPFNIIHTRVFNILYHTCIIVCINVVK